MSVSITILTIAIVTIMTIIIAFYNNAVWRLSEGLIIKKKKKKKKNKKQKEKKKKAHSIKPSRGNSFFSALLFYTHRPDIHTCTNRTKHIH